MVLVDDDVSVRSADPVWSSPCTFSDPRRIQALLAVLVLIDLTVRGLAEVDVVGLPLVGGTVMLVLTAGAWAVPWTRVPPQWGAALAVADLLAVGLARLDPVGNSPVALAALPAYFLARHFGRAGAVGAALGVAALVALPQVLVLGLRAPQNTRLLATSLVVLAGAQIAALMVTRLRREREVAAAIVDSVPVGLVLVDASGRYVSMNPVDVPLLDIAFPTGSTDDDFRIFDADGTLLARHDLPSARAAGGEEFDGVVVWLGDDPATRRAMSISARSVHDERGGFAGASLACHDITPLLRATAVKDDFVASVSHELRTPLTSVLGYLEIALDRDDVPADLRAQLEVSLRNARRLDHLVGDLLTTAGDGVPMTLARMPTDVEQLVESAVAAVRASADARAVRVTTDVEASLTAVVDGPRIRQVLDNLLSNAVQVAAGGGHVQVRAYAEPAGAPDAELVLEVADDGPGLDEADRELIFTRFHRSERSRREAQPGVGLGLSIVRDVVTAHGGRVEAHSEPGHGATFVVRVPSGSGDIRHRARPAASSAGPG